MNDSSSASSNRDLPPASPAETTTAPPTRRNLSEAAEQPPSCDVPTGPHTPGASLAPALAGFLAPPQGDDELGRVERYRVLEVLGAGGMGVVFKAEDLDLQRLVALKAMLPALAADASCRQRFLREGRAAAAVKHDHIVTIHQVGEHDGSPFLAMELLEGQSLDQRLAQQPRLPVKQVLRVGREMAQGLAAAHARGLIHRDIKPANVWLEAPGDRVKILDFGLARAVADDANLTQEGVIVGTPAYMAPEQARGETVNARSDLFSLGIVLYRLCSGRQPFQRPDSVSMLLAITSDTPVPLRTLNPELPQGLADLVMQLLEKDPNRRPASAEAVVEALQKLERHLVPRTRRDDTTTSHRPAKAAGASPQRRRLQIYVAAALLLAALIAAGVWALSRKRTDPGEYAIATDDPNFSFRVSKETVTLHDDRAKRDYALNVVRHDKGADEYEVELPDPPADLSFKTKTFAIRRGRQASLKDWFERQQTVAVKEQDPEKPAPLLILGDAKPAAPGRRASLGYVWDRAAEHPALFNRVSNLGGEVDAFVVDRKNQEYYVLANTTTIVKAGKDGAALFYQHTTYVRDLALDDDDQVYFSESRGSGGDGKIYLVHPPRGSTAANITLFCTARLQDLGHWGGNFAFGRTPKGGLDTDTLYLSSAGGAGGGRPAESSVYRLKRKGDSWGSAELVFTSDTPIGGLMFVDPRAGYYVSGNRVFRLTEQQGGEVVLTLPDVSRLKTISPLRQAPGGAAQK
jgi:serine/threonine protein kinase